jgi:hypothetical protein
MLHRDRCNRAVRSRRGVIALSSANWTGCGGVELAVFSDAAARRGVRKSARRAWSNAPFVARWGSGVRASEVFAVAIRALQDADRV